MKPGTIALLLLVAGVGAYVVFKPSESEKNAKLLKEIAKLIAAIAVLKGKLGKLERVQELLKKELKDLHGISWSDLSAPRGLEYNP